MLEATGNALAIARILEPHVGQVLLAHAKDCVRSPGEGQDRQGRRASVLAELLAADYPGGLDRRRADADAAPADLARRGLVKRRTQIKNEAAAVLHAQAQGSRRRSATCSASRAARGLPIKSCRSTSARPSTRACASSTSSARSSPRLDRIVAAHALEDPDVARLMTIPGIDVTTAATLVAVIGDVRRFPTARHLVGYLGLHPTVRQSGNGPARHGRLSKEGSAAARHVLVEAAWSAAKSPGPLRAFAQRTAARRGRQVATVAVARKLAVLAWHLLTRGEDYAFARPALVRRKRRRSSWPPARRSASPAPTASPLWANKEQRHAESASPNRLRRPTDAWSPTGRPLRPKAGRERDTGARIDTAVRAASSAAGHKLLTPALRHVVHPHPTAASHKEPERASKFDISSVAARCDRR